MLAGTQLRSLKTPQKSLRGGNFNSMSLSCAAWLATYSEMKHKLNVEQIISEAWVIPENKSKKKCVAILQMWNVTFAFKPPLTRFYLQDEASTLCILIFFSIMTLVSKLLQWCTLKYPVGQHDQPNFQLLNDRHRKETFTCLHRGAEPQRERLLPSGLPPPTTPDNMEHVQRSQWVSKFPKQRFHTMAASGISSISSIERWLTWGIWLQAANVADRSRRLTSRRECSFGQKLTPYRNRGGAVRGWGSYALIWICNINYFSKLSAELRSRCPHAKPNTDRSKK